MGSLAKGVKHGSLAKGSKAKKGFVASPAQMIAKKGK